MTTNAQSWMLLQECAAGYGLFEVVAFEEIGTLLEGTMNTVSDLARFSRAVKLKAFYPFESALEALENINAISEHAMTHTLKTFLEMNMASKKTKKKASAAVVLGVMEPGLATAISEGLPYISCRSDETVRELNRGMRLHLTHYIKGLERGGLEQAQLGLGHSYSRSKVKFNPARSDNMIIQSIALLDQLDKDLNTFAMRVREWYSWHFPELKDIVKDNYMFARCAAYVQNKSSLVGAAHESGNNGEDDDNGNNKMEVDSTAPSTKLAGLVEIVGDTHLAEAIVAAAKTSMGMDCSVIDMVNIVNFTQRMIKMAEYRKQLAIYLSDKMSVVAPNLSTLIGDTVAARLISKAGSLTNLAKAPASTVQILGAEKALFRALKTKGNTPKYGLIYHSTFIGRAEAKNKGRISRYLANKCSIATRIDSFSENPTNIYGEKLRDQVEERLKFYETGAAPRKNMDVMNEVARQLASNADGDDNVQAEKKTKKKKKKTEEEEEEGIEKDKKKKKRKSEESKPPLQEEVSGEGKDKKKRARKSEVTVDEDTEEKKSKKTPKKDKKEKQRKSID